MYNVCTYFTVCCTRNVPQQQQQQQQQQKHLLTQIIYKAMIHEYTEYKMSKIE